GWPMPRLMISRPWRWSSAALANTAKAFSSPIRSKAGLMATVKGRVSGWGAPFGKAGQRGQAKDANRDDPDRSGSGIRLVRGLSRPLCPGWEAHSRLREPTIDVESEQAPANFGDGRGRASR